jgi:rare lipoprotein A (peptidoglycan hydrolase)
MQFTGSVSPSAAGAAVEIERLGRETKWSWARTAHATAGSDGSFAVVWHTNHIGRFKFRAVIERTGVSQTAAASPTVDATVYRPATATQYGPGFYGSGTACGQVLRPHTLGVANRTLPCGTPVSIYYQGRTIVVPVIDRGPYANGADWDLTEATGKALGIAGTAVIGAVSLPAQPRSSAA